MQDEHEFIWQAMLDCIDRGILTEGILPGGLNVRRRARGLARRLSEKESAGKAASHKIGIHFIANLFLFLD